MQPNITAATCLLVLCCLSATCDGNVIPRTSSGSISTNGTTKVINICHRQDFHSMDEVQLTTDNDATTFSECRCNINSVQFSLLLNDETALHKCSSATLQININKLSCEGNMTDNIRNFKSCLKQTLHNVYVSLTLESNYAGEHLTWMSIKPKGGNVFIECNGIPRPVIIPSQPIPAVRTSRHMPRSTSHPIPSNERDDLLVVTIVVATVVVIVVGVLCLLVLSAMSAFLCYKHKGLKTHLDKPRSLETELMLSPTDAAPTSTNLRMEVKRTRTISERSIGSSELIGDMPMLDSERRNIKLGQFCALDDVNCELPGQTLPFLHNTLL